MIYSGFTYFSEKMLLQPESHEECPPGHLKCLTELEPGRVLNALDALLAEGQ